VIAAVVSVLFVMLLTSHVYVAAIMACVCLLAIAAWHLHEPEDPA
jgi:hypothetical protein